MIIRELSSEQLQEVANTMWGSGMTPELIVYDALRAETWARGIAARRTVYNRVFQQFAPVFGTPLDSIKKALEDLEYVGDISTGDNGRVAAAPLRAVQIDSERFLIAGGPDTASLRVQIGCEINNTVIPRRASSTDGSQILSGLSAFGAKLLSPERWSGIDRTPFADDAWLADLDQQLDAIGKDSSSLELNCEEWRAYIPHMSQTGQSQWTKSDKATNGRLWRAKHIRGYWLYLWTNQLPPEKGMHISISANEAHRTRFAIDRAAGTSLTVEYERRKDEIIIELPTLLPFQEFRYLTTIGQRQAVSPYAISFPVTSLDKLSSLFQRLGVNVQERAL